MARYIDVEAFKRKLIDEKSFFPAIVARALDEMPAADVVPRAELAVTSFQQAAKIDNLERYINALQEENRRLNIALGKSLPSYYQVMTEEKMIELGKEYGRSEVAREIFEEINVTWSERNGVGEFFEQIAELKKKYMEGER